MHLVNISVKLIGKIEITERFKWENEMFDLAIIVNQIRKLIFFFALFIEKNILITYSNVGKIIQKCDSRRFQKGS